MTSRPRCGPSKECRQCLRPMDSPRDSGTWPGESGPKETALHFQAESMNRNRAFLRVEKGTEDNATTGTAKIATTTPFKRIPSFVKKARLESSRGKVIGCLPSISQSLETAGREIADAGKRARPRHPKRPALSSAFLGHCFASRERRVQDAPRSQWSSVPDR